MIRDDIVICSRGYIGVISDDQQQTVRYPDGSSGLAWIGYHLSAPVGNTWSSLTHTKIGHATGLATFIEVSRINRAD